VLDRDIIQGRGFRNIAKNGEVTGFQLRLRNPNYRGTAGSLLDGVEIIVDGERWGRAPAVVGPAWPDVHP
jgi:hypothetical protein